MGIKLLGYSERGLINSLFYELSLRNQGGRLLSLLLNLVYFPDGERKFQIDEAVILIEPSLSDFGDADAVLFIKNSGRHHTVFIEAKVKTSEKDKWRLHGEFAEFKRGVKNERVSSSNLFTQLYHKQRLIRGIIEIGIQALAQEGLVFPKCSTKKGPRKIGNNPVVNRVIEMMSHYLDQSFFVGLIPDEVINLRKITRNDFKLAEFENDPNWHWSMANWGWLDWKDVEEFCKEYGLSDTLSNFEHNKDQIY